MDGKLQRHDWGDLAHGEMHELLIGHLSERGKKSKIIVLPSFTLQITASRQDYQRSSLFKQRRADGPNGLYVKRAPLRHASAGQG